MTGTKRTARRRPGPAALSTGIAAALIAAAGPAVAQIIPAPPEPPVVPDFEARDDIDEPSQAVIDTSVTRIATEVSGRVNEAVAGALEIGLRDELEARATWRNRAGQDARDGGSWLSGPVAGWGSGSVAFLDNDSAAGAFEGEVYTPLLGADYVPAPGVVVGLSLGYEGTDLDTTFNDGTLDGDGVAITPYAGAAVGEHVILDAGVGYTRLTYDRTRLGGALRGEFDADRIFVFANATGYAPADWHGVEPLTIKGRVGFRYSHEDQDGFLENGVRIEGGTVELGQAVIAGEARYTLTPASLERVDLFARAEGTIDAIRGDRASVQGFGATSDDRTDVTLGIGAVADITERVSADLAYEHVLSREDLSEQSVTVGLRVRF